MAQILYIPTPKGVVYTLNCTSNNLLHQLKGEVMKRHMLTPLIFFLVILLTGMGLADDFMHGEPVGVSPNASGHG
jgi:hypothetical protein